jgi:glucan phosphoethanolaminetransferase (alkaline phosphatase superfamily)
MKKPVSFLIKRIVEARSSTTILLIFLLGAMMSVVANWSMVQEHWKVVVVTALFAGYLPALASWFLIEMVEEDKQKALAKKKAARKEF